MTPRNSAAVAASTYFSGSIAFTWKLSTAAPETPLITGKEFKVRCQRNSLSFTAVFGEEQFFKLALTSSCFEKGFVVTAYCVKFKIKCRDSCGAVHKLSLRAAADARRFFTFRSES